ncbi:hypothetical protein KL86SPO_40713 [uncultured Sporomusa sp.]|uniref:Uncharacterized protein n=1 Tax=uncultured Sporomusa sp. TaxID=307249 RepID=A0A212LXN2_9FIRM|nr:hypothetical protein KL86SPO_40713 [uncultured Sporomusa sp.]
MTKIQMGLKPYLNQVSIYFNTAPVLAEVTNLAYLAR